MKHFKILFPILVLAACTKDISSYNEQTKKPANVPAATLFSNAVRNISDGLANASVNVNVFRFTVKHWAMATYQDEAQYDFTVRAIPDAWWARMYRDVLNDLDESSRLIEASSTLDEDVKANQLAQSDLMQVFTYSILVNTFGNVPYSQALDNSILFPTYDDAAAIYSDLLARVTSDISRLNPSAAGFSSTQDLVCQGNINKWIAFANSLKIRLAMTIADVDNSAAKAAVESSAGNAISSADENAMITYLDASPNTNPLYADIVLGGRNDYLAAEDLMNQLINKTDPRKTKYFGPNNDGGYAGGVVGKVNTASEMSKPSSIVSAANAPYLFLDYSETEFYLAEAIERGYNVGGTAASHYANAIKASIRYWGGTEDEANSYLARTDVNYATATGNWKQKIGLQKWIALYNRPYEAWTELRRFDYPVLSLPVGAVSGFPNRLTYPANEQQTNGGSYTQAAAAIGGDKVETKLFWDVN
ncbi:SusD/RagB family nutrient-binding outer membrane lipoprotein [Foetidibacter luteolus]|uniref:SusD/RagB family nutrient-binding outer membrane lipoprotein n=1 Tax=Foetidibacter luteolus TaxID=2608880 RepID=UPI00129B1F29|nr:SusD/RagB family nutrient-binding outer membrane lipoprotein [Foetidibacter luteolus]